MPKKFLPAVLLLLFLSATAHAADEQRWLFIFDTSSAMKKRLPAVETEIKSLLLSSVDGKLHTNDSIGVWTFDEKLRLGQFPLTWWKPERAGATATNLIAFLRKQPFSGDTKFATLQPMLNRVIGDSERLTVMIFCDGADEIHWTPYDDAINQMLRETSAERKKAQQPFVILLRTQMGKYVGATVNFPPGPANTPAFPLLPREIKPVVTNPPPVAVVTPPPKPAPVAPALIIVGTRVSSDTNDVPKVSASTSNAPVAVAAKTNPSPAPLIITSKPVVAPATNLPKPTNASALVVTDTNPPASTNPAAVTTATDAGGPFDKVLVLAGAALLVTAAALVIFLLARRRRPRGSLITSSMHDDFFPPGGK